MPSGTEDNRESWWSVADWAILAAMALVLTLAFSGYLRPDTTLAPGLPDEDARTQWAPWRAFGFEGIAGGNLPLWNPHVLCGMPFLSSSQSAIFYPPNLLFALLPLHWAARIVILIHWIATACLTYVLARYLRIGRAGSIAAAAVFALGAPQVLRIFAGHWGATCAIAWMPLILLAVEATLRRRTIGTALLGGVAVAMQILAGAPQYVYYTGLATGLYVILRLIIRSRGEYRHIPGDLLRYAIIFVFGALLAGAQLAPMLADAPHLTRAGHMDPSWSQVFSLPPENLVTMIIPGFFGNDRTMPYWGRYNLWEMSAFVGAPALILALAGLFSDRRRMGTVLGACALLMLLLAFGRHIPPLHLLYRALPGAHMLRGTSKFLCPFALFAGLLAGVGIDGLHRLLASKRIRRLPVALAAAILLPALALSGGIAAGGWSRLVQVSRDLGERYRTPDLETIITQGRRAALNTSIETSLLLLVGILAIALLNRRATRAGATRTVCALLVVAPLALFAFPCISPRHGFDTMDTTPSPAAAAALREQGTVGMRVAVASTPALNDVMRLGLMTAEGIDPNPPRRYHEVFRAMTEQPLEIAPTWYQNPGLSNIRNLTGTRLVVGESVRAASKLDRARIAHDFITVGDPARRLELLVPGGGIEQLILEVEDPKAHGKTALGYAEEEYAHIIAESADSVEIECLLRRDGFLVLADAWFPDWQVTIDDTPGEILIANHAFRAVRLNPGKHVVRFEYRPPAIRSGMLLSTLSALFGALWGVLVLLRGRRRAAGTKGRTDTGDEAAPESSELDSPTQE